MRRFHDLDKVFSEAVADLLRANDGRLFATHAPDAVDRGRMPVTDYYDAGHENCFPGSYQLGGFSIAALPAISRDRPNFASPASAPTLLQSVM